VIEWDNVICAVRRVCVGWWPESVLWCMLCCVMCAVCCGVCMVCPVRIVGWVWGCDVMMRESGCEAVRVAVVCAVCG
jgi:hypothetical protein